MIPEKEAQDSLLLQKRIAINDIYSKNDLNTWIFSLFSLQKDAVVLDLCSGRGKQTVLFSERCPRGIVYAVDISKESLQEIDEKKFINVKTVLMDLDSFSRAPLKETYFNLVHCAYGLYYAKNSRLVIQKIYTLLKEKGVSVIVGPTEENNEELFRFIESIYPIDKDIIFSSRDFMNTVVLPECKKLFSEASLSYFNNEVVYPDAEGLYMYIKSSTMYSATHDAILKDHIEKYFNTHKNFCIKKKAAAIIAIK